MCAFHNSTDNFIAATKPEFLAGPLLAFAHTLKQGLRVSDQLWVSGNPVGQCPEL